MSATLPNLGEISGWLMANSYSDNTRPIALNESIVIGRHVYLPPKDNSNKSNQSILKNSRDDATTDPKFVRTLNVRKSHQRADLIFALVEELSEFDSVIIFCASKKECESVTRFLSEKIASSSIDSPIAAER
tara:strand:+ start:1402 stop:1797 length:396 start_codon:yes stop_codon:yes gene_type:complete